MIIKDNAGNAQYCSLDDGSAIYEVSRGSTTRKRLLLLDIMSNGGRLNK